MKKNRTPALPGTFSGEEFFGPGGASDRQVVLRGPTLDQVSLRLVEKAIAGQGTQSEQLVFINRLQRAVARAPTLRQAASEDLDPKAARVVIRLAGALARSLRMEGADFLEDTEAGIRGDLRLREILSTLELLQTSAREILESRKEGGRPSSPDILLLKLLVEAWWQAFKAWPPSSAQGRFRKVLDILNDNLNLSIPTSPTTLDNMKPPAK